MLFKTHKADLLKLNSINKHKQKLIKELFGFIKGIFTGLPD